MLKLDRMKNKGVKKSKDFTLTLSDGIVDPYLKVLGSPITQHNLTVFLKIIPQIVAISLIPRFYYSIILTLLFFGPTIFISVSISKRWYKKSNGRY